MKTTKANAPQGPITPVQTGVNMAQMTTAADSNNYMDSLVNDGKFTREEVDAAWEKAKKMANANKKKDPGIRMTYAYTTSLFNSILGVGKQPDRSNETASVKINAAARLMASVRVLASDATEAGKVVQYLTKALGSKYESFSEDGGKTQIVIFTRQAAKFSAVLGGVDIRVTLNTATKNLTVTFISEAGSWSRSATVTDGDGDKIVKKLKQLAAKYLQELSKSKPVPNTKGEMEFTTKKLSRLAA